MDIYLNYKEPLQLKANGDFQLVSGPELTQQRIIRRLMTVARTYIWHPEYGAGLPQYVGKPVDQAIIKEMQGLILSQLFLEDAVAKSPAPTVTVTQDPTNFSNFIIDIQYYDSVSNQLFFLNFNVSE